MAKSNLVPGHTLIGEGHAFGPEANRWASGTGGKGYAKCSCGATSDVLDSANKRRQWHREHKLQVSSGTAKEASVGLRFADQFDSDIEVENVRLQDQVLRLSDAAERAIIAMRAGANSLDRQEAKIVALRRALMIEWRGNHDERCSPLTEGFCPEQEDCAHPLPDVLSGRSDG